jgi:hypothetical protein
MQKHSSGTHYNQQLAPTSSVLVCFFCVYWHPQQSKGPVMAVDNVNNKSQKMSARVPHEIASSVESLKEPGESTAQFIVTSLQGEIKRRQRKKSKAEPEE